MADAYYNYRNSDGTWGDSDILIKAGFNYPCGVEDWNGVIWAAAWDEANKDANDKAPIYLFKSTDQGASWTKLGAIQTGLLAQVPGIECSVL